MDPGLTEIRDRADAGAYAELMSLIDELSGIRASMLALAGRALEGSVRVHPTFLSSARNLVHYLALRQRDVRALQLRLAALGLSSLGRAEAHVLATLNTVIAVLSELAGLPVPAPDEGGGPADFAEGQRLLRVHTVDLLGPAQPDRSVRIMVTMPSEAAADYTLIHRLLEAGMDCMRINCAHDDPATWLSMIRHLRRAEKALGRSCRVAMDLGGPKLRTGPVIPGPAVVKLRPTRDPLGRVLAPARVWLTSEATPSDPPTPANGILHLPAEWVADLAVGESVTLTDSRGSRRKLRVADASRGDAWAELWKTAYVVPGTLLFRKGKMPAPIGTLPSREMVIPLDRDDILVVTRDLEPGRPATRDRQGRVLSPAAIGCTLPEVFESVERGERILFDDGRIRGVVEQVLPDRVMVRITETRIGGDRLRAGKGINLPDSRLALPALTAKDMADLAFVAEHADVVGLSFANQVGDVLTLRERLSTLGPRQPAIMLKIETRRGFENLPAMLLASMECPSAGVMIARGDLAVECGFERLAEVQEEILWICEAAHVPVIWATQVLETLARTGMPSRAEITDAAMGNRAECVMLNKGPHVVVAAAALADILRRMESHQAKKSPKLRELHLARQFSPVQPRELPRG
jgi:pyruvate kinase